MHKTKPIAALLAVFLFFSLKSDNLPKDFMNLLTRSGIVFTTTEGWKAIKCIENRQMNYEYALKAPKENFEVRYAIRPMDSLLAKYTRAKKKGDLAIEPNKISRVAFQATLLNIGLGGSESGEMPETTYFDSAAVKNEFNADWGATTFVNVGEEFGGKKYKYCMVVAIHKDNVGDAYFFYLSDKKENMSDLMNKPFHSLRFK